MQGGRAEAQTDAAAAVAATTRSYEKPAGEKPLREPCPEGPATPSDSGPSLVLSDLGDLFDLGMGDYMDVFGETGIVPVLSAVERRRAMCAVFGKAGYHVFAKTLEDGSSTQVAPP